MQTQIKGLYVLSLAEPAWLTVLHKRKIPFDWRADLFAARVDEEAVLFGLPSRFGLPLQGDGLHLSEYAELPACL